MRSALAVGSGSERARTIPRGLGGVLLAASLFVSGCGYNQLQAEDEAVKAAWSEVENQYQRRSDLVPNLVATVKGEASFEQGTLEKVVQARAKATSIQATPELVNDSAAFQKFEAAQGELSSALSRLLVTVERYPDLKANQAFRELQVQLEGTENRITVARKRYVDAVQQYNTMVRSFPTNLTAKYLLGLAVRPSFEARAGADQPPEVKF